jgi:acyl-homoserine lactone acylase PvdQ
MLGPAATAVDQALRTLGLATAVPAILAMMPQETRHWVDSFVDGINHYLARVEEQHLRGRRLRSAPFLLGALTARVAHIKFNERGTRDGHFNLIGS